MRHKLEKPVPLSAIVELLGQEVKGTSGPTDREIWGVDSLPTPAAGTLAFCKFSDERLDATLGIEAAGFIVPTGRLLSRKRNGPTLIFSDNPRLSFARAAAWLYKSIPQSGIHPTAIIDPTAVVAPSAEIGPYVVVGARCVVGSCTILKPHVSLERDVVIGSNCKIDAGSTLGSAGFGFERAPSGETIDIPHNGGVVIGDDVQIGCNVGIDRGTMGDTTIENGCRIDNLSQIGHNVRVGRNSVIVSNVTLCGGVRIGERAWIAPNVAILNQIKIGNGATIGIGAIVTRDVPDGATVTGPPALSLGRKH